MIKRQGTFAQVFDNSVQKSQFFGMASIDYVTLEVLISDLRLKKNFKKEIFNGDRLDRNTFGLSLAS